MRIVRQTVLDFKLARTEEALTAHGGLALLAEYNHGLGLRAVVDRHLPAPGSPRGYAPSVVVDAHAMQVEAEKRDAQWTYQKVQGYMPMLGFLFESGLCLLDEFREGHVSPQTDQLGFYRRGQQRLPAGKRLPRHPARTAGRSGGPDTRP